MEAFLIDFIPQHIYLDPTVKDLPVTQRILKAFSHVPVQEVASKQDIKKPDLHTQAKKNLYLTAHKGRAIKSCQGMGDYVCCNYYTMSLVSDCHLECTYCILQDYLKNNPVITVYTNVEEVFAEILEHTQKSPDKIFRIGTGELSDSLALDHITGFSEDYVRFAKENPNILLELKTKTDNISGLLDLDHQKRTVISWSINPQSYIDTDEHKCSTLNERLQAARRVANAGYPVAFNLDPLLYFENWQTEYQDLIDRIAKQFKSDEIAWIAVGSLRFTPHLKKISQERFPKSKIMTAEFVPSLDGKMRYFRPIRERMYQFIMQQIEEKIGKTPKFLCMETKAVWKNVVGTLPKNNDELESYLVQNFEIQNEDSSKKYTSQNVLSFEV